MTYDLWTFTVDAEHLYIDVAALLGDEAWLVTRATEVPSEVSSGDRPPSRVEVLRAKQGEPPSVDHTFRIEGQQYWGVAGAKSRERLLLVWSESDDRGDDEIGLELLGASGRIKEPWKESLGTVDVSSARPLVASRLGGPGWIVCVKSWLRGKSRGKSDAYCAAVEVDGTVGEWHAIGLPQDVMPWTIVQVSGELHLVAKTSSMKSKAERSVVVTLKSDGAAAAKPIELAELGEGAAGWDKEQVEFLEQSLGASASAVHGDEVLFATGPGVRAWKNGELGSFELWPQELLQRLAKRVTFQVLPAAGGGFAVVGVLNEGERTVVVARPRG